MKHVMAAALLTAALASPTRAATTNIWNNPAGGSWAGASSWTPSGVPDGIDSLADFSRLILSANAALTLDATPTVGTLIFGDLNSTKHNWALDPGTGGPLTLGVSSGSPQIFVSSGTATLGTVLAGSSGLTKSGTGTLALKAANTYSGGTIISNGTLFLDFSAPGAPASNILPNGSTLTLNGGTLFLTNAASTVNTQTLGNPTFNRGATFITTAQGPSGSMNLTLGSTWTRNAGASAKFTPGTGTITTGSSAPALNNGIIGGWATVGENFATASLNNGNYNIVASTPDLTVTTAGALAGAAATANVLETTASQTVGANLTINSLISEKNVNISSGMTLTLASGGLIMRGADFWVQSGGKLTSGFNNGAGANDLMITVDGGYGNMQINGVTLANNGSTPVNFIKQGSGILQLSTKVAYTGATIVNAGTLKLSPGDSLSSSSALIINNGGTVSAEADNSIFGSGNVFVPVTINAGGTLTLAAGKTAHIRGLITLNGGTFTTVDAGSSTWGSWNVDNSSFVVNSAPLTSTFGAKNATLASPTTFNVSSGASSGIDLNVTGYFKSGALTKTGPGTMKLSSANNNTGLTTVSSGILALAAGGQNGTLAPAGIVTVASGATLRTDAGDATGWGATGAITNSGTLLKGPGNFHDTLARPVFLSGGTIASADLGDNKQPFHLFGKTLSTVASSGLSTITMPAGANFGLRMNGSANPSFDIAAGSTLLVDTVLTNWDASGDPLIKTSAGTMTVNGALIGDTVPVTVSAGTLNLNSLTYNTAGTITVANNATLQIANLSANGADGSVTVNVNSSAFWAPGTYKIFGYSGSIGGTGVSAFKLGTVQLLGGRQTATINTSIPGEIDVDITGVDHPVWTGALDGTWNLNTQSDPKNWKMAIAGTATDFLINDIVLFDDSAANPSINISVANVAPASVTFNNTLLNYTINGTFGISGTAFLAKNGEGALSINSSNNYTGGTILNGGVVTVGSTGVLGSGPVALNAGVLNVSTSSALGTGALTINGGTLSPSGNLVFANSASINGNFTIDGTANDGLTLNSGLNLGGATRTITVNNSSNVFAGALSNGGLIKNGSGTLVLKARNTYNGDTVINGGTLALEFGGGNGCINGTLTINSGATLRSDVNDSLGWGGGANQVTTLNLAGGTLTHTPANNLTLLGMTINMTGGLIQAIGDTGSRLDVVNGTAINILSGSGTATIGGARLNLRQSTTTLNVADDAAAADLIISAAITEEGGPCGLTKTGLGSLYLTASNTYSGPTLVNAGALVLNGSSRSPITIGASAAFSLGDAFGTASISNTLTLAGITVIKIAKTDTLTNDLVQATNLVCGGMLIVTNLGTASLAQGDSFTLFKADAFSGTFTYVLPALDDGLVWDTTQNGIVRVVAATTTVIAQSAPKIIQGQAATLTATVTSPLGTPSGSVAFKEGASTIGTADLDGSGAATLDISSLAAGQHTIVASYLGNGNYQASVSTSIAQQVSSATTVTLVSSANPSLVGQSVQIEATVSIVAPGTGTATGSIQFLTNGVEAGLPVDLVDGKAALSTGDLPAGTNTIEARYAGNADFEGSVNSLLQVVNRAPVAGLATYGPQTGSPLTISIADLLTHASDADGDPLVLVSVSLVSTNGASITTNGTSLIYTPLNNSIAADSFEYTVSDGRGGFATGTVVISEAVLTSQTLQIILLEDGNAKVIGTGTPFGQYMLQAVSTLGDSWTSLSTNVAGADGVITFSDLDATNHPVRFYRTARP